MFKGLFDFRNQSFHIRLEIVLPIFVFIFLGLLSLSSTSNLDNFSSPFYKQCLWLSIGCFIFILMQYVRMQFLYDYSYIFYIVLVILLLITLFMPKIEGSRRWIIIGSLQFQPSEFGKILFITSLARLLSDLKNKDTFSLYFILMLFFLMIPPLIVMRQPDLGTAIAYLSLIVPMLYWSKIKTYMIFFLISPIVSIFATYQLYIYYLWMVLFVIVLIIYRPKLQVALANVVLNISFAISAPYIYNNFLTPYQQRRIITFLDPLSDPLNSGYQVIQSMISIGSGGFIGKGLGHGTQTHLKFLPVRDSDFIISVMGEELGFLAIFSILVSLSFFIYWCFTYAAKIENKYIGSLIVSFGTLIYMHMIINMGMISGLLPVTGLPAPFISYGGSFFLTCTIMVGLINNAINHHL